VDYIKHHIDHDNFDGLPIRSIQNILDMGTGTGFIALSLQIIKNVLPAFNPKIYASDILVEAIHLSKINAKHNNVLNQIEFIHSDLFNAFPESLWHTFDIIIFNPPYLPSIKNQQIHKPIDRSWDGGEQGFELFLEFLKQAPKYLNSNNPRIYYVCSSRANLKHFYSLIEKTSFHNKILEQRHVFMENLFLNRLELRKN